MKSTNQKILDVHAMVGTKDLNEKETKFVVSIYERTKQARVASFLSPAQLSWLEDLHSKHFSG